MRRRGANRNPPWGPQSQGGTSWSDDEDSLESDEEYDEEEVDDDEVPLGLKVKMRRGSEGVEVKPRSWGAGAGEGGGWEEEEREEAVRRFEERRRQAGM